MSALLDQLAQIIQDIILALNYPGIAAIIFTENVFPPIPSELVLPFAGFLVANGELNLIITIIAATIGSVLGAIVLYYLGLWLEDHVILNFVRRYGKWFTVTEEEFTRVLELFKKRGEWIVLFGRVIPIVRSLISVPAGMSKMPLGRFVLFTAIGSTVWNTLLVVAGYLLGANWEQILEIIDQYQDIVIIVGAVAVVAFVVWRVMVVRGRRSAAAAAAVETTAE